MRTENRWKYCFIDESIHRNFDFALATLVYCTNDPDREISRALWEHRFDPEKDEYKSSVYKNGNRRLQLLEEDIENIFGSTHAISFIIVGYDWRDTLDVEILNALQKEAKKKRFVPKNLQVFVDQGILKNRSKIKGNYGSLNSGQIHWEQDSKRVRGIQLADFAADRVSKIFIQELSSQKKLKLGSRYGYNPPVEAELGWIFRTSLRWNFFSIPPHSKRLSEEGTHLWDGVYLSHLDPRLKKAASKAFRYIYLGCVH